MISNQKIHSTSLPKVVEVVKENCVNCHACIAVCPVKYCNDGSGDHVSINDNLCIGCGACLVACTHDARRPIDDFEDFVSEAGNQKIVAVVAPAIAANFPNEYLNFNGWLKSIGVDAIFDVSFGAELTIKSYIEHITKNKPKTVISQPCPAIVTYIEIFKPELLKYLAPADSPMLHTVKLIKNFYPEYQNHKVLIASPCIAKKREFVETGYGDYNVTFVSFDKYFKENRINLNNYPKVDYANSAAERGVLFSTPGGLMMTAERDVPGITKKTRKIEGREIIYKYLDQLDDMTNRGMAPLLVDCLNCDMGCNGGTGTNSKDKSLDEVEFLIEERNQEMQAYYEKKKLVDPEGDINTAINKNWKPGIYDRRYVNRSDHNDISIPSEAQFDEIYAAMKKQSEKDYLNCGGCGYHTCEKMAIAIHNGLNDPKNCHKFREKIIEENNQTIELSNKNEKMMHMVMENVEKIENSNKALSDKLNNLLKNFREESESMNKLETQIKHVSNFSKDFEKIVNTVSHISDRTNLLSLNAAIEAARAGEFGKGFAIVAQEVRKLASSSRAEVEKIAPFIEELNNLFKNALDEIDQSSSKFKETLKLAEDITVEQEAILKSSASLKSLT